MKNNQNEVKQVVSWKQIFFGVLFSICFLTALVCNLEYNYLASDTLKAAGAFFQLNIAPWLMLGLAVLFFLVCIPLYRKAKKLLAAWDGEDEAVSDAVEQKLSLVGLMSGTFGIVSFFLFAAVYAGAFSKMAHKEEAGFDGFFVGLLAFLVISYGTTSLQRRCLDVCKEIEPERKWPSFYDKEFDKKFFDMCDEAEKVIIGQCTYKAFKVTNQTCMWLAILLMLFGPPVLDMGLLPSLVVCVIWFVNQFVYFKEYARLSKTGNKIL